MKELTFDQRHHIARIAREFSTRMEAKYAKGAREHGGNLWERNPRTLIHYAIEEAIDQLVYLLTLEEKLDRRRGTPTQTVVIGELSDEGAETDDGETYCCEGADAVQSKSPADSPSAAHGQGDGVQGMAIDAIGETK